jgi:uncharacterized protein YecE (DUF72 family)
MIRFGTSGFSYDDWVGPVYPADLPRRSWLEFYAQQFDTVELNVTYYRLPAPKTVEGWVAHTPEHFLFAVKAHGSLTHERQDPDFPGFVQAIEPLTQSGKLACVLAQFPHAFHPTPANREYLGQLRSGFGELPVVVEFRDREWVSEATFELLRRQSLGYCCVDEPALRGLMPPLAVATSRLGYVRLHGRNAARWWEHEQAYERYDYTYQRQELEEWIPRLHTLEEASDLVLVYANNHDRGQSVDALRQLSLLLTQAEA